MYEKIRVSREKVEWRRLLLSNYGTPKWLFISYIAMNKRLTTKYRMTKWGVTHDLICSLCQGKEENIEHLFFACKFTAGV